jgi:hypothetical protein
MDPEGVIAITLIFGGATVFLLSLSPIGKAIAERIRQGKHGAIGPDPEVLGELEQLRNDMTELQERVDFAERLLAQKQVHELPEGSGERA